MHCRATHSNKYTCVPWVCPSQPASQPARRTGHDAACVPGSLHMPTEGWAAATRDLPQVSLMQARSAVPRPCQAEQTRWAGASPPTTAPASPSCGCWPRCTAPSHATHAHGGQPSARLSKYSIDTRMRNCCDAEARALTDKHALPHWPRSHGPGHAG